MALDACALMRDALKYRIEGAGAMTPGQVRDRVNAALEYERDQYRMIAWQTAWLLEPHRDAKKHPGPIEPEQLLGESIRSGVHEPGTSAYERRRAENRREVEAYLALCRANSKRRRHESRQSEGPARA